MKELSIEQKAKAYDKALEAIKSLQEVNPSDEGIQNWINENFPELKESEDERIRKELIQNLKERFGTHGSMGGNLDMPRVIAWLEKQATPQVRTGLEWVNTIDDACDKRYAEEYAHGEYCHEQSFKWGFQEGVAWLEKQGEQKPTEWSEKTKGLDELETYILSIVPNRPLDAIKVDSKNIRFLINKEQKPAWSEEDEYHKRQILRILKDNGCSQTLQERTEKWIEERLKSLRPQSQWKPSDEQMNALNYVVNLMASSERPTENDLYYNILKSLRQQLKKHYL